MKCSYSQVNCEYCKYLPNCEIIAFLDNIEKENRKLKNYVKNLEEEYSLLDEVLDELILDDEDDEI